MDCPVKIFRQLVLLGAILLAFSSCIKEEFNADQLDPSLQINPGVAAPIGWARWQLDEILTDSLNPDELYINSNGFMSLVYKQDLFSLQASEIINIRDISSISDIKSPFSTGFNLNALPGDTAFNYTIAIPLTISDSTGPEIDSIMVRFGQMAISVSPDYPDMRWDAKFRIPGIHDWQITLNDDNPSTIDTLDRITLPLDNTPPSANKLSLMVILTIWPSDVIVYPGKILGISINISGIEYSAIYGYLGQFDIDVGPQSFPVNFFDRLSEGTFHFKDPKLKLEFQNSFGIPIQIDMSGFQATGSGGQIIPISGPGVPGPSNLRILAYPLLGQEGQSIADSIVLDVTNSNLFDVLETSPAEITVEVNGTTNPSGLTRENFLLDSSRLYVSTKLLLPMDGYADLLLIADTLDFVFGDFYESPPEEIKRLIFRLNFISQFPVNVSTQLYFMDEGYTMLDSLFHDVQDPRKIVKGAVDSDGDGVAEPFEPDPVDIELSREQIENISGSHHIIVKGRITTTGYEPPPPPPANVRFYSFYYFHAFISAIAELEINPDDY